MIRSTEKYVKLVYMPDTPEAKLSVSLALQAIQEASEEVEACLDSLAKARASRNRLIRDAYGFIPVSKLQKLTKLSREALYKIAYGGSSK